MSNQKYNSKSDIWSLGVMLYELMCLRLPFGGNSMKQLVYNIVNGTPLGPPSVYSKDLKDLVRDMLIKDQRKRPGINNILARPIMKAKIGSFLDEENLHREFSHTILHGVNVLSNNYKETPKQVAPTPSAVVSSVPSKPNPTPLAVVKSIPSSSPPPAAAISPLAQFEKIKQQQIQIFSNNEKAHQQYYQDLIKQKQEIQAKLENQRKEALAQKQKELELKKERERQFQKELEREKEKIREKQQQLREQQRQKQMQMQKQLEEQELLRREKEKLLLIQKQKDRENQLLIQRQREKEKHALLLQQKEKNLKEQREMKQKQMLLVQNMNANNKPILRPQSANSPRNNFVAPTPSQVSKPSSVQQTPLVRPKSANSKVTPSYQFAPRPSATPIQPSKPIYPSSTPNSANNIKEKVQQVNDSVANAVAMANNLKININHRPIPTSANSINSSKSANNILRPSPPSVTPSPLGSNDKEKNAPWLDNVLAQIGDVKRQVDQIQVSRGLKQNEQSNPVIKNSHSSPSVIQKKVTSQSSVSSSVTTTSSVSTASKKSNEVVSTRVQQKKIEVQSTPEQKISAKKRSEESLKDLRAIMREGRERKKQANLSLESTIKFLNAEKFDLSETIPLHKKEAPIPTYDDKVEVEKSSNKKSVESNSNKSSNKLDLRKFKAESKARLAKMKNDVPVIVLANDPPVVSAPNSSRIQKAEEKWKEHLSSYSQIKDSSNTSEVTDSNPSSSPTSRKHVNSCIPMWPSCFSNNSYEDYEASNENGSAFNDEFFPCYNIPPDASHNTIVDRLITANESEICHLKEPTLHVGESTLADLRHCLEAKPDEQAMLEYSMILKDLISINNLPSSCSSSSKTDAKASESSYNLFEEKETYNNDYKKNNRNIFNLSNIQEGDGENDESMRLQGDMENDEKTSYTSSPEKEQYDKKSGLSEDNKYDMNDYSNKEEEVEEGFEEEDIISDTSNEEDYLPAFPDEYYLDENPNLEEENDEENDRNWNVSKDHVAQDPILSDHVFELKEKIIRKIGKKTLDEVVEILYQDNMDDDETINVLETRYGIEILDSLEDIYTLLNYA